MGPPSAGVTLDTARAAAYIQSIHASLIGSSIMPTTVQKWGKSLGIRIPKSIAEQANIRTGTEVELETDGSVLTVRPRRRRKYTLAWMLAKMKGPNPHRDLLRDGPVGRELI